jgi:hypothetical protein
MGPAQLAQWQWDGYVRYHGARSNLLIHIVAVPLFLAGNIAMDAALFRASIAGAAIGFACMVVSMALQGRGHKIEKTPPEPFTGVGNAVARILLEQWVTFPTFVLTGSWSHALRALAR